MLFAPNSIIGPRRYIMHTPETVRYQSHPGHIELTWPDGTTRSFLYVWLRDNCPTARHNNGQKRVETSSIPLDIYPEQVSLNELGVLELHWRGEDHVSYFDVEVLKKKSEPSKKWTSIIPGPAISWEATLDIRPLMLDYSIYMESDPDLYGFLDMFTKVGFGIIKGAPRDAGILEAVVNRFGYIRETNYGKLFHVKAKHNPDNLADTALALSPHTDNPYRDPVPTLQLLHCLESSAQGGETILVDGFRIAEYIYNSSIGHFNMLSTTPVTFRFRNEKVWLEATTTFFGLDSQGYIRHIRLNNRSIRPFDVTMRRLHEFYKAYYYLLECVESNRFQVRFKMEPGDIVLFDNQRILHGRTAYEGAGQRHLVGCYADRDGLLSKWRILRRDYDESLANTYTFIH